MANTVKYKILVYSPYYPPHTGGLETHADEFNKYLSLREAEITVFTPRIPNDLPEEEIIHDGRVKVIRFPAFDIVMGYPIPKFWSGKFRKMYKEAYANKYDIVISRTRFFLTSVLALLHGKMKNSKFVHVEHGSDYVQLESNLKNFVAWLFDHTLGRIILNYADEVVNVSSSSAEFCKKFAKNKSFNVINRGVEFENIENVQPNLKIREKYKGKTIITFIGRLMDGKGVHDLLQAIKIIENENIVCFVIGDGPQFQNLNKLARQLNIQNKVVFFGRKKMVETIGILKVSDILVNPSYTEGLPTTVIEAALCKTAIIATNVGGTPEAIGKENAFLIEPKNPEVLKEKILLLINDPELKEKMIANAYLEIKDKFNWERSIDKYVNLFNSCVE